MPHRTKGYLVRKPQEVVSCGFLFKQTNKMNTNDYIKFFEEFDDSNDEDVRSSPKRTSQRRESKKLEMDARLFVRAQEISREFQFTYKAARFEEAWLLDSLVEIAEHQWISDVLRKVKSGKEASV